MFLSDHAWRAFSKEEPKLTRVTDFKFEKGPIRSVMTFWQRPIEFYIEKGRNS